MADDNVLEFHRKQIAAAAYELGVVVVAAHRAGLRVNVTVSDEESPTRGRSYPMPILRIKVEERPVA